MALNGDDEFEWEPPTEAEMKVLEAQRERQNKISKLMGDYLLKGYKMLGDCCQHCATILLEDRQKNIYCVACQELDSDVDKDNPALNAQAALSQVRERQLASQPSLQSNGEAVFSSSGAPRPMRSLPRPEHCEGAASGLRTPAGATTAAPSAGGNTGASAWSPAVSAPTAPPHPPAPRPGAPPLDPASTSPSGGVVLPLRPPGAPQTGATLQQALGEAEQALLGKLQWASCQLEHTPSVEASLQLCQLIQSCATSLRSVRDLQRD